MKALLYKSNRWGFLCGKCVRKEMIVYAKLGNDIIFKTDMSNSGIMIPAQDYTSQQ